MIPQTAYLCSFVWLPWLLSEPSYLFCLREKPEEVRKKKIHCLKVCRCIVTTNSLSYFVLFLPRADMSISRRLSSTYECVTWRDQPQTSAYPHDRNLKLHKRKTDRNNDRNIWVINININNAGCICQKLDL